MCDRRIQSGNQPAQWKFWGCQSASAAVARSDRKLRDVRRASLVTVLLPKREREHASRQQKQVKRASDKVRFHRGANVRFHLACASVRKHLLLEMRPACRDNFGRLEQSRSRCRKQAASSHRTPKRRCGDRKHSCELVFIRG